MMTQEQVQRKVKGLLAMQRFGTPAESQVATIKLAQIRKKYGDLANVTTSEEMTLTWYRVTGQEDCDLLQAIISKVCNLTEISYKWIQRSRKFGMELTEGQAIEVRRLLKIYRKALCREKKLLFRAFIHSNKLFARDSKKVSIDQVAKNEDHLRELRRMLDMSCAMPPTVAHKPLTGGTR